jgi:hypothetical protein
MRIVTNLIHRGRVGGYPSAPSRRRSKASAAAAAPSAAANARAIRSAPSRRATASRTFFSQSLGPQPAQLDELARGGRRLVARRTALPAPGLHAYAHPTPDSFGEAQLSPAAARWEAELGLYVLDWDDIRAAADSHALALEFAHSAFQHACLVCDWDENLTASAEGTPPPVS